MDPALPSENDPLLTKPKNEELPRDRGLLVYLVFYLLGIGSLLPWNFFSNAKMYFMFKLRNTSDPDPDAWRNSNDYTNLQTMFESYLTLAAMLPNVLFMFLNTAATKYIPLKARIIVATSAMIAMFLLTIILTPLTPSKWASTYFMPVSCFLTFNVFDLIGRTLAGPVQWPREGSPLIPILSVCRVLLVPVFLFSNVQPRHHLTVYFHSDWVPIVTMAVFAISNGYLSTLCMMYGPMKVLDENLETAGAMMSFLLSLGLGLGSVFSLLLVKIV